MPRSEACTVQELYERYWVVRIIVPSTGTSMLSSEQWVVQAVWKDTSSTSSSSMLRSEARRLYERKWISPHCFTLDESPFSLTFSCSTFFVLFSLRIFMLYTARIATISTADIFLHLILTFSLTFSCSTFSCCSAWQFLCWSQCCHRYNWYSWHLFTS